ncbi:enoyl-CoA hydratase/isomerase family protein [Zafaria sp. J156]|uniref:enoyl-CoA hydratase/isomerase family protein n=1 Tax=Zafaria sp. J156 TaxID=3116490 RepID=UPI002E78DC85|nr:enoyl-CoA hydratase/isomerase family protein [Zafaria sp. J156]MEE1621577.1 enoyl-CoA hydratase/isomerase family protein [Zafaria sp. J156]
MSEHVLTSTGAGLGLITLNRPEKINALTRPMVAAVGAALDAWREDPAVRIVVLRGAGERGFCAGGDIKCFYESIVADRHQDFLDFLAEEFAVDHAIATYPKPVVAFMDGLCMGGGVGLAGHASVRIVTPRSKVGMPETRIGYSPDVGGTHLLGLAPGHLGEYFALTAGTMGAADAIHAGFADFCVAEDALGDVLDALPDLAGLPAEDLAAAFEVMHGSPAPADTGTSLLAQPWIDAAFAGRTVADILASLDSLPHRGAADAARAVRSVSPLAAETALQAVRAARAADHLPEAFDRELRLAAFLMDHPDLPEGIRAQVIDKDRNPHWSPADPADVDREAISGVVLGAAADG